VKFASPRSIATTAEFSSATPSRIAGARATFFGAALAGRGFGSAHAFGGEGIRRPTC
jgi:hypothetical protein